MPTLIPTSLHYSPDGTHTVDISLYSDTTGMTSAMGIGYSVTGDRAVFAGGISLSFVKVNTINYFTISSVGDSSEFGDLSYLPYRQASFSNGINGRGVFGGGNVDTGVYDENIIEYVTITTTGNTTNFGDLTVNRHDFCGFSNGTNQRGLFCAGWSYSVPGKQQSIDYVTINSPGDAGDFGDLTQAKDRLGGCSNASNERGLILAGRDHFNLTINEIEYVTMSSLGDATDFGDTIKATTTLTGTSNDTNDRGIIASGPGGGLLDNVISYVTITSLGNAADFGDLTLARSVCGAASNGTNERAIYIAGADGTATNIVDFITINSIGDASDFGDTLDRVYGAAATSNGASAEGTGYAQVEPYVNHANASGLRISPDGIHSHAVFKTFTSDLSGGDTAVFMGGFYDTTLKTNTIDYTTISSTGNASDFGDSLTIRYDFGSTSNGSDDRGVFGGGALTGNNLMDYVTISTPSSSSDFGDLTYSPQFGTATDNSVYQRGIFGGGVSGGYSNVICYITINTLGNAADFGDLTVARASVTGTSNSTNERGVFGGASTGEKNIIDYVTIYSLGDASDFGDLLVARGYLSATSNGVNDRGVFVGGLDAVYLNSIDYITISSTGDASDWGDLLVAKSDTASTSNTTNERGLVAGGYYTTTYTNVIEYITINSPGSGSTDFGDLTLGRAQFTGTSNAN